MGEHAIEQMRLDFKRMTGVDADSADFKTLARAQRPPRPTCTLCQRKFRTQRAVADHARDVHLKKAAAP